MRPPLVRYCGTIPSLLPTLFRVPSYTNISRMVVRHEDPVLAPANRGNDGLGLDVRRGPGGYHPLRRSGLSSRTLRAGRRCPPAPRCTPGLAPDSRRRHGCGARSSLRLPLSDSGPALHDADELRPHYRALRGLCPPCGPPLLQEATLAASPRRGGPEPPRDGAARR